MITDKPRDPEWIKTVVEDGNVILRWTPNQEEYFYSYELFSLSDRSLQSAPGPVPLRSAIWVDTAPLIRDRAVKLSGQSAPLVVSSLVVSRPLVL